MSGLQKERKTHCWLFLPILVVANLVVVNGGNAARGGCKVSLSPGNWSVSCQHGYHTGSMFLSANKETRCAQTQRTLSCQAVLNSTSEFHALAFLETVSCICMLLSYVLQHPMLSLCSFCNTDISASLWCKGDYLRFVYFWASLLNITKVEVADLSPTLSHPCPGMSVTGVQRQQVQN